MSEIKPRQPAFMQEVGHIVTDKYTPSSALHYDPVDLSNREKRELIKHYDGLFRAVDPYDDERFPLVKARQLLDFAIAAKLPSPFIEYALMALYSREVADNTQRVADALGGLPVMRGSVLVPEGFEDLDVKLREMLNSEELNDYLNENKKILSVRKNPKYSELSSLHALSCVNANPEFRSFLDDILNDPYYSSERKLELKQEHQERFENMKRNLARQLYEKKLWYHQKLFEVTSSKNTAQRDLLLAETGEDFSDLDEILTRKFGEKYSPIMKEFMASSYFKVQSMTKLGVAASKNPVQKIKLGGRLVFGKPLDLERAKKEYCVIKNLREVDSVLHKFLAGPMDELFTVNNIAFMIYPDAHENSELLDEDIYSHKMILLAHLHHESKMFTAELKGSIEPVTYKEAKDVRKTLKELAWFDDSHLGSLVQIYQEYLTAVIPNLEHSGIHNDAHWENYIGGSLIDHESFVIGPKYLDISQALWDIHPETEHSLNDSERKSYFRQYLDKSRELEGIERISDENFAREYSTLRKTAVFEIMYRITRFMKYENLRTSPYRQKQLPFLRDMLEQLVLDQNDC